MSCGDGLGLQERRRKYAESLSTPLWHTVIDIVQKMPFLAMQADVVQSEGCRVYYFVGLGPKSVE